MTKKYFNGEQFNLLREIIVKSEEMVADYYKMSTSDWKKLKYEFKTLKDLTSHEIVDGPFAQVVKYDAKPWGIPFASSAYTIYRICIQDNAVIDKIKESMLPIVPFFHYIVVHELLHVVRFSKYIKKFEAQKEEMEQEEEIVHDLTKKILERCQIVKRMEVFEFFNISDQNKKGL